LASQRIYEFVWNEFCDWYLELAKVNLQSSDSAIRSASLRTVINVLETILRVVHPILPFLSEELWQVIAPLANKSGVTIMLASYPQANDYNIENKNIIMTQIAQLKHLTGVVRNLRAEMGLPPVSKVPLILETQQEELFSHYLEYVKVLAKVSEIEVVNQLVEESAPIAVVDGARLMLKVEIDVDAEKLRLQREIDKHTKEVDKMAVKLNNPNYLERAPANLVERDQLRVEELTRIIQQLQQQLIKL
jgi:valyl-tRNA synthetase